MIILIGGNSSTGKTLMAQNLLEKYLIPYFSIDHLKMGLYRSDKECGFTPLDSNEVIAEKIWPVVKEIIKTNIENHQHLIIEGCYIMPEYIKEFEEKNLKNIVSVFLGFSNKYIKENFKSEIIKNRSVIEKRIYPDERPVSQFINEHTKFRKKCAENNVNYFEIKKDYEEEIKKVYKFIDSKVDVKLK